MKIRFNDDPKIVETVREGLRRKDGYCPCRLQRTPENICMCQEFRDQIADPNFEGYCHCRLYYKENNRKASAIAEAFFCIEGNRERTAVRLLRTAILLPGNNVKLETSVTE